MPDQNEKKCHGKFAHILERGRREKKEKGREEKGRKTIYRIQIRMWYEKKMKEKNTSLNFQIKVNLIRS